MNKIKEQKIIDSWQNNVQPWIRAVREGEIESRLLVTNNAIIDVILKQSPKTVLDIGCGEGWLCRELNKSNITTLGIDVVSEFIESAQKKGVGSFKKLSHNELVNGALREKFDIIVCNFSLFGKESVEELFHYIPHLLTSDGLFIIQTIHPISGCGEAPYEEGWRKGSWTGFSQEFKDPAPWYFRTIEAWKNLYLECDFKLNEIVEPLHPTTEIPASIIFVGTYAGTLVDT
ncbi:MAG: class I SAM-dependent methyltransferase [Gammaproteobacteria bacterium]|nr:class I SAM-dependent methyltransferase [Gammaproteobacteria bacterium]